MTEWPPEMLVEEGWLMSLGERAALTGILARLQPDLAIEIGRGYGGSLRHIAANSREVHSIDITDADLELPANARLHIGDSRSVLPELLERFSSEGRNVDFVLVDGDHSAEGVRSDLENLLASPALARTVIVIHDTLNATVRNGVERVRFDDYPKLRYVGLDFVAGFMVRDGSRARQLWGGLGLVVVDDSAAFRPELVPDLGMYDTPTMLRLARRRLSVAAARERLRAARRRVAAALGR